MAVESPSTSPLRIAADITQLVGHTPMLQLGRVVPAASAAVFAKLEFLNPGGSIKDRAALGMILDAEAKGLLRAGFDDRGGHGGQYRRGAGADRRESRLQGEAVCAGGIRRGEVHPDARLWRGGGAHAGGRRHGGAIREANKTG